MSTTSFAEPMVRIEGLRKSFGDLEVLRDINLDVMPGQVVTIIGASGSGKSTLLRCINLLETPDAGHVWFHGADLAAEHVDVNRLLREDRHGLPGLQPVQQHERARQLHARARDAAQDEQGRGRGGRAAPP